jgi:hypothetical protein
LEYERHYWLVYFRCFGVNCYFGGGLLLGYWKN